MMSQSPVDLAEKLKVQLYPNSKEGHCLECGEPFSDKNIFSEAGWRESKISQLCEKCFDTICAEPEEEDLDDEPAF